MEAYMAMIVAYGFNWAPRSWATCQGQILAISSNQALFALIGTTYGGDGRTTFGLPDLQGRVPVGQGHGSGLTPRTVGQKFGVETNTMTINEMPSHNHVATGTLKVSSAAADDDTPSSTTSIGGGSNAEIYVEQPSNVAIMAENVQVTVNNAGNGRPMNNIQPSLVINWSICTQGIFPPRS